MVKLDAQHRSHVESDGEKSLRTARQEDQRRMARYAVVRGRETQGWKRRRLQLMRQRSMGGAATAATVKSVPDKAVGAKVKGLVNKLRPRGLRNKSLLSIIAKGKFDTGDAAFDGITKRRFEEAAYISREITKFARGRKYGVQFRSIMKKLDRCSPRQPSGSMLSPISRHRRELADYSMVRKAFAAVPTDQIFMETKLIALTTGTVASLPKKVRAIIDTDRQRNRSHVQHFRKKITWYADLQAYKIYELECYRAEDLRRAHKDYLAGELPEGEETAEGDVWLEFMDWREGRNPPKISKRKIETLLAMGWSPASNKDVWLIHSHAIIRVKGPEEYKRLQKKNLYPLDYQVVLTALRKTKSRDENLRDIVRYMQKATPRYGMLFSYRKKEYYLTGAALRRFIVLYDTLGYQGLKAHFGLTGSTRKRS